MIRPSVTSVIAKASILIIAASGITSADFGSVKWAALQVALFALPVLALIYPSENRLIWAFWASLFLLLQALASPFIIERDFVALAPNVREVVDVKDGIPGIQGVQVITTDWRGFRTTKNIDYGSRNGDGLRIFAIGASTTAQVRIDDLQTWTNLLQTSLERDSGKNVEVINTGVAGTRAAQHLATLRSIAPLHPDVAIFLVGINDWNIHIIRHFSYRPGEGITLAQRIADFRHRLQLSGTPLGNAINRSYGMLMASAGTKRQSVRDEYGDYYAPQRGSLGRRDVRSFRPQTVLEDYAATMEEISAACKRHKIKCVFATQPTGYQESAPEEFKKGFWMTPPNQDYTLDFQSMIHMASLYNAFLKSFAERHGHYLCDAAAKFMPTFQSFYDDCHFNTAGAAKMALVVKECLAASLFPPDAPRAAR